ncbi:hypothetical protein C1645_780275 [Glomus cerebriforme]|uniref:Uncharacterized protein n=1 Tax=Glomus cerebriforme TaxID=658196 RepID=A0A397SNG8_9GLOM|nr:hypothetical protein C1645_780275 [Glomus cerebriforme]
MKKLLVSFLVASLLISLVVALDHIVVTDPVTDQKLGSIVDVKWDTTQIPKGLKPTDKVSVRIKCGRRSVPPKAVPHVSIPLLYIPRSIGRILIFHTS